MTGLSDLLARQGFVVLDGGLASELEARGANLDHALWSAHLLLSNSQMLEAVSLDYLQAGADVITTASYQATILGLIAAGLTAPQAEGVLRQSVALSRGVRDQFWADESVRAGRSKPLVAASIGPYGAYLHDGSEYLGHYGLTKAQLKDFHRARLAILVESEPDVVAFESFPSQLEAEAVVELLEQFPRAQAWVSFTCKDDTSISEGTLLADAVAAVTASPQIIAAGVNCTAPHLITPLLRAARERTNKALVAYPNSGECFDAATGKWGQPSEAETIQSSVLEWLAAGARLIGGCCRTTPETIRGIRSVLNRTGTSNSSGHSALASMN